MLLGLQVSSAGKIYESIGRAVSLGCNTMQIFNRNPRQWRTEKLGNADIKEFRKRREEANLWPVFVHVPYLINLASPHDALYNDSIKAYVEDIKEVESLGIEYIVTHMGSYTWGTEEKGIKRITGALNKILDKTKNSSVVILLENTAGSGSWLGYKFQHHKEILDGIEDKKRVGICLDTCHAFVAGYAINTKEGFNKMLKEIDNLVGLKRLKLVHLNDAKAALGSHHDRHEHIGKGNIGRDGLERLLNHPKLKNLPFILETPKESDTDDIRNLKIVKTLFNTKT